MNQEDVILKLRALKVEYIQKEISKNPAALSEHLGVFLGYATFLYEFYGDKLESYEKLESKVIQEESDSMTSHNSSLSAKTRSERRTVAEMQNRIDVRLAVEKGKKKRLEQLVKGNTLHINGCQSLMKNWSDEAKGIR